MINKCKKIIGNTLTTIVIVFSLIITIITIFTNKDGIPSFNGYSPFSIQSNSMYPSMKKGDIAITYNKILASDLKVNDVVAFYFYENGTNIVKIHRIINITRDNEALFFETKGDNNDVSDKVLITEVDIIGKSVFRIPLIGYLIDFIKNKWVFFFLILVPLFILLVYQLVDFIRLLIEYRMDVE